MLLKWHLGLKGTYYASVHIIWFCSVAGRSNVYTHKKRGGGPTRQSGGDRVLYYCFLLSPYRVPGTRVQNLRFQRWSRPLKIDRVMSSHVVGIDAEKRKTILFFSSNDSTNLLQFGKQPVRKNGAVGVRRTPRVHGRYSTALSKHKA